MEYKIEIPEFEGPLDLLLHLIKQDNIDIHNISIERITKQYLEYIEMMEEINLNIASEYLVMAAELLVIKSASLLPHPDIEDDEYEEDPKEKLIKRLLEYEQYKKMTETFKELENYRGEVYTKEANNLEEYIDKNSNVDYGVSLDDLVNALNKFLSEKELSRPLNTKVTTKEYSIGKRSVEIRDILRKNKKIDFVDLFKETRNKEFIIVTFLAILSMSKKQEIEITQENNFNNIVIKMR